MSALAPATPVLVNATRLRSAHAAEWDRLDALVTRIEKRSVRALDDEDLLALPQLYRTSLSSLAVARETSLDRALVTYLEQLCARAYFQIYGPPSSAAAQLGRFFTRGWPLAVQAIWRETLVALLLTLVGALTAFLLVRHDPANFYTMIPDAMAEGRDPSASAETLHQTLYGGGPRESMLATFAASLFTHNAQIAIFAFALGFAFAVPTVMLVLYNGVMLGAFVAVFVGKGLGPDVGGWLVIHGSTEIFAIILAGAAGMRIGWTIAFPGRATRTEAAATAGRSAAVAMAGAVAMLAVAGLLEGIGRQTVQSEWERWLLGLSVLTGWLIYFYLPRKADALAIS